MQLIKSLLSNPINLIVLFSTLTTGLLIIAYFARKVSRITETKMDSVEAMRISIIADAKISAEFEEWRMRALGVNDSAIHDTDWSGHIYSELEFSEG